MELLMERDAGSRAGGSRCAVATARVLATHEIVPSPRNDHARNDTATWSVGEGNSTRRCFVATVPFFEEPPPFDEILPVVGQFVQRFNTAARV
jgi:hypothetical protein